MAYLLLVTGFVLLVKGADWFVSGSSAIAEHFHIPGFIIGLTIVACGTSLPEAAISVAAALQGANGIVVGNALGSNMMNLLVVLGASALVRPCTVERSVLHFEYPLSILAAALLLFLIAGGGNAGGQELSGAAAADVGLWFSRVDGLILLAVFVMFLYATVRKAVRKREAVAEKEEVTAFWENGADGASSAAAATPSLAAAGNPSLIRSIAVSLVGAACIILGGDLVVDAATAIASGLGVDETLIGLTVVAFGTSLPELVTSMVAAFKGRTDIAVGNVIGSNLFNLLFVLGLSTSIHPIAASMFAVYDLIILIIASLIVLIPLVRNGAVTRSWGFIMLAMYGVYLTYIIGRTM